MKAIDPNSLLAQIQDIHQCVGKKSRTSLKNMSLVPLNATIRLEYMKCGKRCKKCSENYDCNYNYHGPYFCAYWRDKFDHGKLRKKYIGEWTSELEERLDVSGKNVVLWNPISKFQGKLTINNPELNF